MNKAFASTVAVGRLEEKLKVCVYRNVCDISKDSSIVFSGYTPHLSALSVTDSELVVVRR